MEIVFHWMQQILDALASTNHLSGWVYSLVFAGGVASAISPCYLPVLTMFGGYVGGFARGKNDAGVALSIPFVLGNMVTLAFAGAIGSLLGNSVLQIFTGYELDRWIPGLVGLVMGLQLLGVLRLRMPLMPLLNTEQKPTTSWGSFFLGLPFGLVVTPCTIPIFFAIVAFVALQGSVLHGALLMATYALGRGIVLLAVGTSVGLLKALHLVRTSKYGELISGTIVLIASLSVLLFYRGFVQWTMQWMPMKN